MTDMHTRFPPRPISLGWYELQQCRAPGENHMWHFSLCTLKSGDTHGDTLQRKRADSLRSSTSTVLCLLSFQEVQAGQFMADEMRRCFLNNATVGVALRKARSSTVRVGTLQGGSHPIATCCAPLVGDWAHA